MAVMTKVTFIRDNRYHVKVDKNGRLVRDIIVCPGTEFVVIPHNKADMTHRSKRCTFLKDNGDGRAVVRLLGERRNGIVEYGHLAMLDEKQLIASSNAILQTYLNPQDTEESILPTDPEMAAESIERFGEMISSTVDEMTLNQFEFSNNPLLQTIAKYQGILDSLLECKDSAGVSKISQGDIGKKIDRSPSYVSKTMQKLILDNCVEQIGPGRYRVLEEDVMHVGSIQRTLRLMVGYMIKPESYTYKLQRQAALFNMSLKELQQARGMLHQAYGSPKNM